MKQISFSGWTAATPLHHVETNDGIPGVATVADARLSHCILADKFLRDVTFKDGMMRHCRFEFCNLRAASFERIDFTGTSFLNCDLTSAKFSTCKMWYTSFEGCGLAYDSLLASAPTETNLRQLFLNRLRQNALSLGDKVWADKLLHRELLAERDDLVNIILRKTAYYKKHYSTIDRLRALGRLALHYMNGLFWGHGLRLGNLVGSGATTVAIFAAACHESQATYMFSSTQGTRGLTWPEAIYYSLISFTTGAFGDIMPGNAVARGITAAEGLFGIMFLGFFAAAVYRKYSR